jgi:ABC-type lipoprotein export system ATPase subunit
VSEVVGLENVRKELGEGEGRTEIVRGVSLSIRSGEFVALMGASGSGKSTLLSLIGLLDRPTSGALRLCGRDAGALSDDEAAALRSRSIGFVFQNFHLLPYLSARQNVALPMEYAGRADAAARALELLDRVGLSHRRDAHPATLSGGEKQRVAIARALANEPPLLLADEPTGALDSKTGAQILNLFADLNNAGSAVLLVTHDEKVARRAGRVLSLRDGRLE